MAKNALDRARERYAGLAASSRNRLQKLKESKKVEMGVRAAESIGGAAIGGAANAYFDNFEVAGISIPPSAVIAAAGIGAGIALDLPDLVAIGHGAACATIADATGKLVTDGLAAMEAKKAA
jgi:hypothetical protein